MELVVDVIYVLDVLDFLEKLEIKLEDAQVKQEVNLQMFKNYKDVPQWITVLLKNV